MSLSLIRWGVYWGKIECLDMYLLHFPCRFFRCVYINHIWLLMNSRRKAFLSCWLYPPRLSGLVLDGSYGRIMIGESMNVVAAVWFSCPVLHLLALRCLGGDASSLLALLSEGNSRAFILVLLVAAVTQCRPSAFVLSFPHLPPSGVVSLHFQGAYS